MEKKATKQIIIIVSTIIFVAVIVVIVFFGKSASRASPPTVCENEARETDKANENGWKRDRKRYFPALGKGGGMGRWGGFPRRCIIDGTFLTNVDVPYKNAGV